jgi:hypothetical protein
MNDKQECLSYQIFIGGQSFLIDIVNEHGGTYGEKTQTTIAVNST